MTHVFISYARERERQAEQVAEALRAAGYGVWRDDEIPAHRDFAEVIEERLGAAGAVVVIWSAEAARSQWVRSEADRAREARKLVQISVDASPLPMPFDQIQCADLRGWGGDAQAAGWKRVLASVGELVAQPGEPARAAPVKRSAEPLLAVLAFDNLSGDAEMAYFSDGVSEEIQQTVARGAELKVIGKASSFRFRGADKAAANVSAELAATHVLDGSVRRAGQRVRISAQLVECAGETTLWADRFDRDLTDIFALQDEIAQAVANALKIAFAPTGQSDAVDPKAYDLYLQGLTLGISGFIDQSAVIAHYERVIALAPNFGSAWAILAHAMAIRLRLGTPDGSYAEARARIEAAAGRALAQDPGSGHALTALLMLLPWGAYAQRETLIRQAIGASPNNADALIDMAWLLANLGRTRESMPYAQRALDLDPYYTRAAQTHGAMTAFNDPLGESGRLSAMLEGRPDAGRFVIGGMLRMALLGDIERLTETARMLPADIVQGAPVLYALMSGKAVSEGTPAAAAGQLERICRREAETGVVELGDLLLLDALGLGEEAYRLVAETSFAYVFDKQGASPAGSWNQAIIFSESLPMGFRRDPRFVLLCQKLGLCDHWIDTDQWPDFAARVADVYDLKAEAHRLTGR